LFGIDTKIEKDPFRDERIVIENIVK